MTRDGMRAQGAATARRLFGSDAQPPGLGGLVIEASYGAIWSRPGLATADRLVCAMAALATGPRMRALRRFIGAALEHGVTAEAAREVLVQASLYAGFSAAEETLPLWAEVLTERGMAVPPDASEDASYEELDASGAALMGRLHGARAQQGYAAPDNPFTGQLYPAAIRYGYGVIWSRPGLDERRRALLAVAAFTALRLTDQVAKFGQSALNVGVGKQEVVEAIITTAPLTGFPPALNALAAFGAADAVATDH